MNKKMAEVRKMKDDKLHKELKSAKDKLRELLFSVSNGQIRNPHKIKEIKKYIARILTELNSRVKSTK